MSKKADDWAHKLMTTREKPKPFSDVFARMEPVPNPDGYEKIIFRDSQKEKEWNELDPAVKEHILSNLRDHARSLHLPQAIDMLCHIINDLSARIKKLEDKQDG